MKLLIRSLVVFAIGLVFCVAPFISTEDNLSEKNKIITNLKNEKTRSAEIDRIKNTRQTQIKALLQIVSDYPKEVKKEKQWGILVDTVVSTVDLLGEIRAEESIDSLVGLMCFEIDIWRSKGLIGLEDALRVDDILFHTSEALTKIGHPVIPALIELIKSEPPDDYIGGKVPYIARKNLVARLTLYRIEGNIAIYHLEKALKEETDEKKKKCLSQNIAKFREELESGAYNK